MTRSLPRQESILSAVLCLFLATVPAGAQTAHKAWMDNGGGPDNSHYVEHTQINKSNVKDLAVAWSYPSYDNVAYVWNPLIVDNLTYVLARNNSLVALDAVTGKEIWIHADLQGI